MPWRFAGGMRYPRLQRLRQCADAGSGAILRQGARRQSLDFQSLGDAGEDCRFDAGFGEFRYPRSFTDGGEEFQGFEDNDRQ